MGKKGGKAYRGKNRNRWDSPVQKVEIVPNQKWIAYYHAQGICESEDDWDKMVSTFMTPLPASLRISFDCPYGDRLKAELQSYCGSAVEVDGKAIEAVSTLPWFPEGRGFSLGLDRSTIRKSTDPRLRELHQWLIGHTDSGMLTRQEAVSMIPPCVLQVEPHHVTLDMCAAPGSKTTQIVECIMRDSSATQAHSSAAASGDSGRKGGIPGEPLGLVVANDCDTQRAYMLAHQCKRLNSPSLVITTHMGQFMPNLERRAARLAARASGNDDAISQAAAAAAIAGSGTFDRVLADVPCSGDGTIRKQPTIVSSWAAHAGGALHPLQLAIALRGLNLCKVGGLLVYSTCSLNPIENEAVVAAILQASPGSVELLEARHTVPGLKTRPGLNHWHVFDDGEKAGSRKDRKRREKQARKDKAQAEREAAAAAAAGGDANGEGAAAAAGGDTNGEGAAAAASAAMEEDNKEEEVEEEEDEVEVAHPDPLIAACLRADLRHYPTFDDVPASAQKGRIRPSMFPPSTNLGLEKCMRLMPHDQNTGGFFVALLRKVAPLVPPPASAATAPTGTTAAAIATDASAGAGTSPSKSSENAGAGGAGALTQKIEGFSDGFDDWEEKDATRREAAAATSNSTSARAGAVNYGGAEKGEAEGAGTAGAHGAKRGRDNGSGGTSVPHVFEEYYRLADADVVADVMSFYGIPADGSPGSFPTEQLYARSPGLARSLTYLTRVAKDRIVDLDVRRELKIVSAGLKMFEKNSANNVSACKYRLAQDAVHIIEPFMNDARKVIFTPEDLARLVERDETGSCQLSGLQPSTSAAILAMSAGAFIAVMPLPTTTSGSGGSNSSSSSNGQEKLLVTCWRGRGDASVNVMCSKENLHVVANRVADMGVTVQIPNLGKPKMDKKEEPAASDGTATAATSAAPAAAVADA